MSFFSNTEIRNFMRWSWASFDVEGLFCEMERKLGKWGVESVLGNRPLELVSFFFIIILNFGLQRMKENFTRSTFLMADFSWLSCIITTHVREASLEKIYRIPSIQVPT